MFATMFPASAVQPAADVSLWIVTVIALLALGYGAWRNHGARGLLATCGVALLMGGVLYADAAQNVCDVLEKGSWQWWLAGCGW